jgi:hypothetical protein
MTQPGAVINTQGFGNRPENVEVPFIATYDPSSTDNIYPVGKRWVNTVANDEWVLTSFSSTSGILSANWLNVGGGASQISTINSQAPIGGNFNMVGTTNEITVTPTAGTDTFSIPASFVAPGSITSSTTINSGGAIIAATGDISASTGSVVANAGFISSNGSLTLQAVGGKINIMTGSNASIGTSAAMTAGSITISTTAVTAASKIFLTTNAPGGTQGFLSVGTIVPATSFVINSSNSSDTSTVNWWIIN